MARRHLLAALAAVSFLAAPLAAQAQHGSIQPPPPSGIQQQAMATGGPGETPRPVIQGRQNAAISIATATTTEIVAAVAGKAVFVSGGLVKFGGTGDFKWVAGTGVACGTGTRDLTGAIPVVAQDGWLQGSGLGVSLLTAAGEALCAVTTSAATAYGNIIYEQRIP